MTNWRDFDPALAEVLTELPDGGTLVISGDGGQAQFSRSDAVLVVEVGNESAAEQPRLVDRGWQLVDTWSGIWRRHFPNPNTLDAATTVVAETSYALRHVFGWPSLEGFAYASWREVNKRILGLIPKTEEKPLSWPTLGLRQRREDEQIND